ncbi:MAG: hypothetical protein GXO09_01725 [Crenarchaeota archaeon]|nr:hypothetical protein [Thermoproteota archaeon]
MPGHRIPPALCARCKGYKKLCGLPTCPILAKFRSQVLGSNRVRERQVEGSTPPCMIIGEKGYPKIPAILYTPPGVHGEPAKQYDNPTAWHRSRTPLGRIIEYRSYLVGGIMRVDARKPWILYEKELSIAAASLRPVDAETLLHHRPQPILKFDGLLAPHGPSAPAERIRVDGNPTLPRRLEKLIWDDARASEAVVELYTSGTDYYTIITAFSLGLLGRLRNRRLVPTRWAITAVDDTVARWLLSSVKTRRPVNEYRVYHARYLGNHFTILLAPGAYTAEMIEIWHPLTPWTMNASKPTIVYIREDYNGNVEPLDGGYMAARLPVLEHLNQEARQARILIVREVTREYYAPVGNWHIRETVREAFRKGPVLRTSVLDEAVRKIVELARNRRWVEEALRGSRLLRTLRSQRTLDSFLT